MASKVIALQGQPIVDEQNSCSAAITPGDLIEIDTAQWRKHATAAKNASPWFALERDEMGDGIDVDYAANDIVKAGLFSPGMKVNARIAIGETLVKGDKLESAGAGTLRKVVTDAATDDTQRTSVVGEADEAVPLTAAITRAKVKIV